MITDSMDDLSDDEFHYYHTIASFCELITAVVENDDEEGSKQALLHAALQAFLDPDVYEEVFGKERF